MQPSMTLALATAAIILLGWVCWPIVRCIISGRGNGRIIGGPELIDGHFQSRLPPDIALKLARLGFSPIGVYLEWVGYISARLAVFASGERECFAYAFRLLNERPGVTFFTTFADGALIKTSDHHASNVDLPDIRKGPPSCLPPLSYYPPPAKQQPPNKLKSILLHVAGHILVVSAFGIMGTWLGPDSTMYVAALWAFLAVVLTLALRFDMAARTQKPPIAQESEPRAPLPDVLAEHRQRICRFMEAGHSPIDEHVTTDDFLRSEQRDQYHWYQRQETRLGALLILVFTLIICLLVPAALACICGIGHPAGWGVLLFESLLLAWLTWIPKALRPPSCMGID